MSYSIEKITITKTSMRSRVENKTIPSINWPSLSLDRTFEWVAEENGWFQKIAFKASAPNFQRELDVSLSRQGIVKTNGKFSAIYNAFLKPIENTIRNNIILFSNRSRMSNPEREIKPLYIDLGAEIFADLEENKRFIDSLKKMKAANVSVTHGNPYISLTMIDYYDGSVHDIWVLEANTIIIIPQIKSSYQSLKRLINHIFDTFAEGQIVGKK